MVETRRYYNLRFVLDGIRSFFRLVVLKCVFMFKSNSLCKSETLVAFFWCRQDQKGTGGGDIHTVTVLRNGYVQANIERSTADVWY